MSALSSYQGSTVYKDKALANFALQYENNELVADKVAPIVPTDDRSGTYFKTPKENTFNYSGQAFVGAASDVPETEGTVEEATYSCKGRGRKSKIALQTDADADVPLNLREGAVLDAMAQLMLEREVRVASLIFDSANYKATTNTVAISTKWDTKSSGVSTADPISDVDALRGNIFRGPNTRLVAVMSREVWTAIKNNTFITARINGGATTGLPAIVMKQLIASIFEVDEVVIAEGWKIAAGTQSRVWGKAFAILSVTTSPSVRSLGFAQTMRWQALGPGGIRHEQWIDPSKGTMGVEYHKITMCDDEVIPANDAGILFTTAVTLWPTQARRPRRTRLSPTPPRRSPTSRPTRPSSRRTARIPRRSLPRRSPTSRRSSTPWQRARVSPLLMPPARRSSCAWWSPQAPRSRTGRSVLADTSSTSPRQRSPISSRRASRF